MGKMHKVDERLYTTEDGSRVVKEGDPEARHLYATPGSEVPLKEAEKYGLVKDTDTDGTSGLSKMKKDELITEAEARGLDTSGTNDELRDRITEHDEAAGGDEG